jgi:hypothetical protein
LLRARRVRPCRRRTAERTEKFAPPHVQPQSQEQASQWAKTIALRKGRGWPSMLLGGDGRCPSRVSSTDLTTPKFDFRSSPKSGLKSDISPCPKSANYRSRIRPKEGSAQAQLVRRESNPDFHELTSRAALCV